MYCGASTKSSVAADADVIVVGGGFVGLATALALGSNGRNVVVLESRTGVDRRFRGELIHPGGVRVLAELGLLATLEAGLPRPCHGFAVTSSGNEDPLLLNYPVAAAGATGGLVMCHTDLHRLLLEAAEKSREITIVTGATVTGVVREGGVVAGVTTRPNTVVRAGLTIVCDGRFSSLRRELGFAPDVSLVSHTLVLTTHEIALPRPGYGHVFLGGPGPVLAYELGGGTVRVCVDIPPRLTTMHPRQAEQFVGAGYLDHLPKVLRGPVVDALRSPDSGMSANVSVMGLSCWAPGLVLMGDSAVCSHPLTAMGMTAGLRDAIALRDELDRCPDQLTALYRFDQRRLRDGWLRNTFTNSLYEVFSGGDDVSDALRRGMFRHWRGSDRARQKTMALLAGDDQRLRTFITEYAGVARQAITPPTPDGFPRSAYNRIGLISRFLGVARTVLACRCRVLVALLRARVVLSAERRRTRKQIDEREGVGV